MTIGFILNGEAVVVHTEADRRLIDILRETFGLSGAKRGCLSGHCGACSVIMNGAVVPACIVPAFRIRDQTIITIEGFSQTDAYQDLRSGFQEAGVELCGYCDAGKILIAEALLAKNPRPARHVILAGFSGIQCRCTEPEDLVKGVLAAVDIRRRRLYDRTT
ncbi:MAG: 2Fe-2S iron-sulfur cluster binding domain-containing protein [Treponema sp.]|jgi:carbon-monoxide dehydrogenase small subunit|nr:2Fe-2S iron-sulfur cluster binding domain-containing protein [Treponema sp.]